MTAAVSFVVIFHIAVFIAESMLWMHPAVYERALTKLNDQLAFAPHDQALILSRLFVNQGFYNLCLALTGLTGLLSLRRGHASVGHALIATMCLTAISAGAVLALSTRAYAGAFLQAVPAVLALALTLRARRRAA
jgi:putative membrane protein